MTYLMEFFQKKTERKGHFNELWYQRIMPDGSKLSRDWLSYSPRLNIIFCLSCMLYSDSKSNASIKSWTQNGYSNWQNAKNNITAHEISTSHTNSSVVLKINKQHCQFCHLWSMLVKCKYPQIDKL